MARDAVIVSTARTGIGKAYRGAFNATPSPTLAAHPIRAAIERAKVDPAEVDDVIIGAALQQGVQTTIGRTAALRAGLPVTVAGMSIDRQCSSGLMSIATAAKQIIVDRMEVVVAGEVDQEIVAVTATMAIKDKETGEVSKREIRLDKDEGNRPDTTLEGLAKLEPVRGPGNMISAGNASQLSDGASASVLMNSELAE